MHVLQHYFMAPTTTKLIFNLAVPAQCTFININSPFSLSHNRFFSRIDTEFFELARASPAGGLSSVMVHKHCA